MKFFLQRFMYFCLLASVGAMPFAQSASSAPCAPFYNLDADGHETAPTECATPLYTLSNLPVSLVRGTPQTFTRPEGGTHWYEAVYLPDSGLNWLQARALAEEAGGYLATITSNAEGEHIFSLIDDPKYWYQWDSTHSYVMSGPFLGGYQPGQSAEPSGGWRWVSGEAFSYTNWCKDGVEADQDPRNNNQPNDATGGQDVIAFGEVNAPVSYWGDFPHSVGGLNDQGSDTKVYGFIIEYDANPSTASLTIAKTGGNGTVVSEPAGINCGATCIASFNSGDSVTLTATPDTGYSVSGWSGDCAGTSDRCTLTMDADKSVTALFAKVPATTFSEEYYLANNLDVAAAVKKGLIGTGWQHYQDRVLTGLESRSFTMPIGYETYNELYYLANNPDVAMAVEQGALGSGWQHYQAQVLSGLENRSATQPINYGNFNEEYYLVNNPDVAIAVHKGYISTGWQHYQDRVLTGLESRSYVAPYTDATFNEEYYLANNPDVAQAVESGLIGTGWQHYQANGQAEERVYTNPYLD
ncbi:MAG: hypothetical protein QG599_227 [Pseudomonadota bacterium]|nr:hypothetical protein [Pseudomonadota bacterium]